jgi:hypothetical protein
MPGGAWTFGGSILTFLFPMILFVLVATALFVSYTKPEVVPGHWVANAGRSVSYTFAPGPQARAAGPSAATTEAAEGPAAEGPAAESPATESGAPATKDGEAGTGDGA